MSLQLKQLNAFCAVVRSSGFSDAAKITGMSQPTLSRLVKQLENDLGVELIDRYQRPLKLTKSGAFFYDKTIKILDELDAVCLMTQRMAHPPKRLVIGFVPSVLYGLLPNIIARLKQQRPQLDIQLKDIPSYQQLDALKTGAIDVGFGRFAQQDALVKQILLRHERYVAALPKSHDLAATPNLHVSQLSQDRLILYHQTHIQPETAAVIPTGANVINSTQAPKASNVTEPLLYLFARYGLAPFATTTVSDLQIALGLVAAGEGVTLVPDSLKTLRSEQICYQTLRHEDATSPIYLNTLDQTSHPEFEHLLETIYQIYEEKGITYRR